MPLGDPHEPKHRPPTRDKSKLIAAGILLAIPVVALMAVPTYARTDPTLWGFPFFFWYQFLWVFLCSATTYAAYRLVIAARHKGGDR